MSAERNDDMEKGDKEKDLVEPLDVVPVSNKKDSLCRRLILIGALVLIVAGIGAAIGVPVAKHLRNKDTQQPLDPPSNAVSTTGFFNSTLQPWSEKVTQGYATQDELEADLENVALFLLNNVVSRNMQVAGFENAGRGRSFETQPTMESPSEADMGTTMDDGANTVGDDVND